MKTLSLLIKRNTKLFFRDKALFFTSLITPAILLVLYSTFLSNVYRDSFLIGLPEGMTIPEKMLDALVAGQLTSSILAVSCVTVAFCTNMLSVQDKANGTIKDISITPVDSYTLALGYYISAFVSTAIVCFTACALCFAYTAVVGWYLTALDVLLILLDVFLLTLFGVALSSVINFFLSTQGQISAVGSIVSSCYGFICGAYMPISSFSEGLANIVAFLPGTYGTSLLRNHTMQGVLSAIENDGIPVEFTSSIRDSVDCNIYLFDGKVPILAMFGILAGSCALLILIYIIMHVINRKKH